VLAGGGIRKQIRKGGSNLKRRTAHGRGTDSPPAKNEEKKKKHEKGNPTITPVNEGTLEKCKGKQMSFGEGSEGAATGISWKKCIMRRY